MQITGEIIVIGVFAVALGIATTIMRRMYKVSCRRSQRLEHVSLNLTVASVMLAVQRARVQELREVVKEGEGAAGTLIHIDKRVLDLESFSTEVNEALSKHYPNIKTKIKNIPDTKGGTA